jgi:hypothetical protein
LHIEVEIHFSTSPPLSPQEPPIGNLGHLQTNASHVGFYKVGLLSFV